MGSTSDAMAMPLNPAGAGEHEEHHDELGAVHLSLYDDDPLVPLLHLVHPLDPRHGEERRWDGPMVGQWASATDEAEELDLSIR